MTTLTFPQLTRAQARVFFCLSMLEHPAWSLGLHMSTKRRCELAKTAGLINPVRQALDDLALGQLSPEQIVAWSIFTELGRLIARARRDAVSQEAATRMADMMQTVLSERSIDEDRLVLLNQDFVRLATRIRVTPAIEVDRHIATLSIMARLKSPLLSWGQGSEK